MAYTTLINLKKYMPIAMIEQLSDDYNTGSLVTEIVEDMISAADKLIDGHLRGRYPDEIAEGSVPDLIEDLSTKLAAYNLYKRKLQATLPEAISKDYKYCIQTLKDIQVGKITPFPEANEPAVVITNKTSSSRTYTSTVWDTY
ncbi:MAG: DUF1320 domain-containing protein [Candidatus Omnitrophica bacterium]|nr:DUF1320 domain-containing protein [Candidatus Omnitrophota bacterium]